MAPVATASEVAALDNCELTTDALSPTASDRAILDSIDNDATTTALSTAVLDVLNAAFADCGATERVDWLLLLNLKEQQGIDANYDAYAVGVTHGVAVTLGVPVDVVARQVRLGDGTPLLLDPPTSDRERLCAVVRAAAWRDNLGRPYGDELDSEMPTRSEYRALLRAAKALGIEIQQVPPEVDVDIDVQIAGGMLPDDPELLAVYRRAWIAAEGHCFLFTPSTGDMKTPFDAAPMIPPDPPPPPQPATPRRRIVEVGRPAAPTSATSPRQ